MTLVDITVSHMAIMALVAPGHSSVEFREDSEPSVDVALSLDVVQHHAVIVDLELQTRQNPDIEGRSSAQLASLT